MAAPAIALRFRDTTPGIDTIVQHRSILASNGTVSWGWWKKTFENEEYEKIAALLASGGGPIDILILDRSTERAFMCRCVAFDKPDHVNPQTIPEYYRDYINLTAGAFQLETIDDIAFDPVLGDAIGDQTFLWVGSRLDPALGHIAEAAVATGRPACYIYRTFTLETITDSVDKAKTPFSAIREKRLQNALSLILNASI